MKDLTGIKGTDCRDSYRLTARFKELQNKIRQGTQDRKELIEFLRLQNTNNSRVAANWLMRE